ncbi:MAG: aspartate-semialdehyde dehydrogenase [Anaerolineae bacterium]|nr:aspartate-semialdehyde dehydrogenase [Anaerolineae bacterium]
MSHSAAPIQVGILGATGAVGQRLVQLLDGHPWFRVAVLAGSERSAGRPYAQACRWLLPGDMPAWARDMEVQEAKPGLDCQLVFSALPGSAAGPLEEAFAAAGYAVCSTASAHRMDPDVPILVPEVNPEHLDLIRTQQRQRDWRGFLVAKPNCSSTHLVTVLKPLWDAFGLRRVVAVTLQALSGAGYPGVPSLDIVDNVVPYISGEEEKVEQEPRKILGRLADGKIEEADLPISAQCTRVPVLDGHLECVSVELERKAPLDEVVAALEGFRGLPQELGLPHAPERVIVVRPEPDRPQPRLDRDAGAGMSTTVGRVRPCPVLDYRLVLLGHNTVRGAAGGALLTAELLYARGYLHNLPGGCP